MQIKAGQASKRMMVATLEGAHADMMIDLGLAFDLTAPAVALISTLAILWVLRRDHRRRGRALRLRRRLQADLDQLHTRGEEIRGRALWLLGAERYGRIGAEEQAKLTRGCDEYLREVEALKRELSGITTEVDRLRGRALEELHHRLERVNEKVAMLRQEANERDALWPAEAALEESRAQGPRQIFA